VHLPVVFLPCGAHSWTGTSKAHLLGSTNLRLFNQRLLRERCRYEFYYEDLLSGQYMWKIQSLHEKYGSTIRINQEEVDIQDAAYFDEIYLSKNTPI
jgi:hypothetical protein